MTLIQIPDTKFFRDTNSMALINKDSVGLEEYNLKRRLIANQKSEINKIKSEIDDIKSNMEEIKQLITNIIKKG